MTKKVLSVVMAGGKGERLYPLTRDRAKPAVPFGGKFRIIDFALSNLVNSGIHSIYVLTQFKSQSLSEHLEIAWNFQTPLRERFISAVPAQMRTGESWYKGTADAIYQNLDLIFKTNPDLVVVLAGDHICRMDLRQMLRYHDEKKADVTIATLPVPLEEGHRFGVVAVDESHRIIGFQEKPAKPAPIPGRPGEALASMGNYIFNTSFLVDALKRDAADPHSSHDFGKDILPSLFKEKQLYSYDFTTNIIPGGIPGEKNTYWKDVGTIEAYFEANMDLRAPKPLFNFYNDAWPIHTIEYGGPPAKFVHNWGDRVGHALNSLVCEGSILSGTTVLDSIIGRSVFIHSYSQINECIIMDNAEIGRHCKLKKVIVDKNVRLPEGTVVGFDPEHDKKRYFVSEGGIVVIPKESRVQQLGTLSL